MLSSPCPKVLLAIGLTLSTLSTAAFSAEVNLAVQPVGLTLSYDDMRLPGNEAMGLLGATYYWKLPGQLEVGVAGYGAITGERGGFFTGGVELAKRIALSTRTDLGAGLYLGGGGGGGAPQGGGLMLRPHLDLRYQLAPAHRIGLSLSQVSFPNGSIISNQLAFLYDQQFDVYLAQPPNWRDSRPVSRLGLSGRDIGLDVQNVQMADGTHKTNGQPYQGAIRLVGAKLHHGMGKHGYLSLATHGAFAGGVDGYAQVMAGAGLRHPLGHQLAMTSELSAGMGGGGAVDAGGGLLLAGQLGMQYTLSPILAAYANAGYMMAPAGDLAGMSYGMGLAYRYDAIISDTSQRPLDTSNIASHHWRVRAGLGSYLPTSDTRRKNGQQDERAIGLVSVVIDLMQGEHLYFTGQAYSAVSADAGGYSKGLVGAGLQTRARAGTVFGLELAAGAAGGGGLAVGHGIVAQPMLFIEHAMKGGPAIRLSGGVLIAPTGTFNPATIGLQLVYPFASAYSNARERYR